MDKIFGSWSWWPWSQQQVVTTTVSSPFHRTSAAVTAAAANIFMSSSSSPLTASSATATVATTSIPTTNLILKAAAAAAASSSSSNSQTSETQPFIVSTATTIAAALSSFIQNDILGNGSNSTASLMGSSTSVTMDPFGNDTLFDSSDFTEDELLFRMIWSNATADAGSGNTVDLLLERNGTNGTHGGGADMDYENTWHLVKTIATALILGFIILATVIGKYAFKYYYTLLWSLYKTTVVQY